MGISSKDGTAVNDINKLEGGILDSLQEQRSLETSRNVGLSHNIRIQQHFFSYLIWQIASQ